MKPATSSPGPRPASPRTTFEVVRAALVVVAIVVMALYTWRRFAVSSDITSFLPTGTDTDSANVIRALAASDLTKLMILSVEAKEAALAAAAAGELGDALQGDPHVAWVRSSADVDEADGKSVYDAYFPRRMMMLSDRPEEELPARLSEEGLTAEADNVKGELAGPLGPLMARIAGADPLRSFPAQLRRLETLKVNSVSTENGHFITSDRRHGVVFLATRASPFASDQQGPFLATITRAFDKINAAHGGELKLEQSGINRFAVAAEASMKGDIARLSLLGMAGSVLLLLAFFRSPLYVVLLTIPIGAGMLTCVFACLFCLGSVHGVTLGFGSSLIGICVDYPIYFFNDYTLGGAAGGGPRATIKRIQMSLFLGALTTVAGFAGMAWTSFPGIREIAIFGPSGIVGAFVVTCYLLPHLVPPTREPTATQVRSADLLQDVLSRLRGSSKVLLAFPVIAIVVSFIGLPRIRWSDDLEAFNPADPALAAEDQRVRDRVSSVDSGRLVVAVGDDEEAALRANDAVYLKLREAKESGIVDDFRSIHMALWSKDLQARNLAVVRAVPDLGARAVAAFSEKGFRSTALESFSKDIAGDAPLPLTAKDLEATPLSALVKPFRVAWPDGRVGILTMLQGVNDATALEARIASVPGVSYFDRRDFLRRTYARFRARTTELIIAGLVVVFGIVLVRYRHLSTAVAAFLPSVFAAATATSILGLLGVEQNLMNSIGLLLVLSMGVDYGIFAVETSRRGDSLAEGLLSVFLATATTILSLGLLAFSSNPALHSIGLTAGLGVTLSFVFTPIALLSLRLAPAKRAAA